MPGEGADLWRSIAAVRDFEVSGEEGTRMAGDRAIVARSEMAPRIPRVCPDILKADYRDLGMPGSRSGADNERVEVSPPLATRDSG